MRSLLKPTLVLGFGNAESGGPSLRSIAVRLFITCWLVYGAHFATNTVREIFPALSLGDHLSFDVSEYKGLHPDIFELPGRGVFINNNPGASILGAVPYIITRPVIDFAVDRVQAMREATGQKPPEFDTQFPMRAEFYRAAFEKGLDVKFALGAAVMQSLLMAPVSALGVVVMFLVLVRLTGSTRSSLLLALLYAFATPLLYRTAQLNHNLLLMHFAFFAFVLIWRPWDENGKPNRASYLLAGILAGWTVVFDYSGMVTVLALGIYVGFRWLKYPTTVRSYADLALFAAGTAIAAAVLMGYQWSSFGHPIFPAQTYMPSTEFSVSGYSGLSWPSLDLLWRSAFGLKFGLFAFAPILVFALYVPGWFKGRASFIGRRETWFILLLTAVFFIFSAANQFGYLQFNTGVRHMVPVVPFVFLLAAGVLLRMPTRLAIAVGVIGTYWSWSLAMYREVGDGHPLGVLEAVTRTTLDGVRLPWLTTLEQLGYVPDGALAAPMLLMLGVAIILVWTIRSPAMFSLRGLAERG
ncbi:MAG: hypothetical protein J4O02_08575 [Chloroflexi bacterium]|nr:hypothetical protein [Chloroflexota bacterium]